MPHPRTGSAWRTFAERRLPHRASWLSHRASQETSVGGPLAFSRALLMHCLIIQYPSNDLEMMTQGGLRKRGSHLGGAVYRPSASLGLGRHRAAFPQNHIDFSVGGLAVFASRESFQAAAASLNHLPHAWVPRQPLAHLFL
jgi:hypothetical protein